MPSLSPIARVCGRRPVLRRLAIAAALAAAPWLNLGAQVSYPSEFDTGLDSIAVAFKAQSGMTMGYLSQPKAAGKRPGVVVLHDLQGLSNGVRGAARAVANAGYAVVAPDYVSPQGGTAGFRGNEAAVQKAITSTTAAVASQQTTAALGYLKTHGGDGGRGHALYGIGWGGTQALTFASGRTDIAAVVAFYPDPKTVIPALAKLTAPTLIILAGNDPATKEGAAALEKAASASKGAIKVQVFPDMARGFHDPGAGAAYKADVAKEAWTAVLAHLDANAKDPNAKEPAKDAKEKPRTSGA